MSCVCMALKLSNNMAAQKLRLEGSSPKLEGFSPHTCTRVTMRVMSRVGDAIGRPWGKPRHAPQHLNSSAGSACACESVTVVFYKSSSFVSNFPT